MQKKYINRTTAFFLILAICKSNFLVAQQPFFQIAPQTVALAPCSTTPVILKCINVSGTPGIWLYQWSVGAGWNISGTFVSASNTLILTPSSPTVSPGSVSVTAFLANNASASYYGGFCSVFRSLFTSNAFISGNTGTICNNSSANFTLSGLATGQSVLWSVSNSSIASLSNSSNTQTTVTMVGSGSVDLQATIVNACGNSIVKTLSLHSGVPTLVNFTCSPIGNNFCSGTVYLAPNDLPTINTRDKVTANFKGLSRTESATVSNWDWQKFNNNINIWPASNTVRIGMLTYGATGVEVKAKNVCGWSEPYSLPFTIVETPPSFGRNSVITSNYNIFPNPAKDYFDISLKNEAGFKNTSAKVRVELVDKYGRVRKSIVLTSTANRIYVSEIERGVYFVKIYANNKIEQQMMLLN